MEQNTIKNSNKIVKVIKIVIDVLLYTLVAVMLIFSISIISGRGNGSIPNLFGNGYLGVESNSMEVAPNAIGDEWPKKGSFNKSDLIFVRIANKENRKKLEVGDVVTFFDDNIMALNTHRIVYISGDIITTQGDYRASQGYNFMDHPDTSETFHSDNIYAIHYSPNQNIDGGKWNGFGAVLIFLQRPVGFGVVVVLPVLAVLVYEGIKLARIIIQNNRKKTEDRLALEKAADIERLEAEKEELRAQLEAEKVAERNKMREELLKEMEAEKNNKKE